MKKTVIFIIICLFSWITIARQGGFGSVEYGSQPAVPEGYISAQEAHRQEAMEIKAIGKKLRTELIQLRIENTQIRKENSRLRWMCQANQLDLSILKNEKFWPNKRFTWPMKIGDRAFLSGYSLTVKSIFSPTAYLAAVDADSYFISAAGNIRKVNEVIYVKIEGLSSEGLVDGLPVSLSCAFEIKGTDTFAESDDRQSTVFVLHPLAEFPKPIE